MQKTSDGLDRVATLELHGEWMFGRCDASLLLISPQGRLERRFEDEGNLTGQSYCEQGKNSVFTREVGSLRGNEGEAVGCGLGRRTVHSLIDVDVF